MKTQHLRSKSCFTAILGSASLFLLSSVAHAAPYVWNSASAQDWSTTTAWTPTPPTGGPGAGDTISVATTSTTPGALDLSTNESATSISDNITSANSSWTITTTNTGADTLTLSGGLSDVGGGTTTSTPTLIVSGSSATKTLGLSVGSLTVDNRATLDLGTLNNSTKYLTSLNVSGTTTVTTGSLNLNVVNGSGATANASNLGLLTIGEHTGIASAGAVNLNSGTQSIVNVTVAGIMDSTTTGAFINANSASANLLINVASGGSYSTTATLRDSGGVLNVFKQGAGTQQLKSVASNYSGTTTISGGILNVAGLANAGSATSVTGISGQNTITVGSAAGLVVGQVAFGTGIAANVTITGISGTTVTLSAVNSGAVSGSGNFGTPNSIGISTNAASNLVLDGGILQYTGATATSTNRNFTLTGSAGSGIDVSGSGALTMSGNLTNTAASGTATLGLSGTAGVGTLSGALNDGANALTALNKTGTSVWTLSGASNYTGGTNIQAGSLVLASTGSLSSSNAVVLGSSLPSSGTFVLGDSTGAANTTVSSLTTTGTGSSNAVTGGNAGTASVLTINNSSTDVYAGFLGSGTAGASTANNLAVTKSGVGALTLSNINTFTGPLNVNAGKLIVSGSTAAASNVFINSGGTLGGASAANEGTLNGAVTVASGSPGGAINLQDNAIGTLHVGGLTVNGGTLSFDIGAGASNNLDLIASTGSLTIGGATTITIGFVSGSPTLTPGTYSLITYTGTPLTTAQFDNLSLSSTTLGSYNLTLINGGTGSTGVELQITAGTVAGTTYSLATTAASTLLHQNGTTTLTTTVTNTGNAGADTLNYSGLGASSSLGNGVATGTQNGGPVANSNGTATNSQTYTATNAGTDNVSANGSGTNATVGGSATLSSSTGTTINVYTGKSTWAGTGATGTWGTLTSSFGANWGATQGSPGLDPSFTGVDTATFGNVSGHSAVSVTLDGASPNVNSITFSAPSTSYTLASGTGGNITLSGTAPTIVVSGGAHTISAPIVLGADTAVAVATGQQLTLSGQVSGSGKFTHSDAGTTILSSSTGNTYSGGTVVNAGTLFVNSGVSGTSSGTGSGAVTVNSGATLAGSGNITTAAGVTVSGGTLASGAAQTAAPNVTGPGLTLTNTSLAINSANLAFNLGAGTTPGASPYNFTTPNTNTTYLTLAGSTSINFTGTDSISLVDLTTGSLALRLGTPYLLISGTSDSQYTGLVTAQGFGADTTFSLDGNGYVLGVATGNGTLGSAESYTPIAINQFGPDGITPLSSDLIYPAPTLYLNNGNLEVVPEPGTWALMLGGLVVLIVLQRRKKIG